MMLLELVRESPDWTGALAAALTLPPGMTERRRGEDPWQLPAQTRPRRISDDLAWLRQAMDEPGESGLNMVAGTAAVAAWRADNEAGERCSRLRDRGVLDAGGFVLHEGEIALSVH
jgi:hypothetical protein